MLRSLERKETRSLPPHSRARTRLPAPIPAFTTRGKRRPPIEARAAGCRAAFPMSLQSPFSNGWEPAGRSKPRPAFGASLPSTASPTDTRNTLQGGSKSREWFRHAIPRSRNRPTIVPPEDIPGIQKVASSFPCPKNSGPFLTLDSQAATTCRLERSLFHLS